MAVVICDSLQAIESLTAKFSELKVAAKGKYFAKRTNLSEWKIKLSPFYNNICWENFFGSGMIVYLKAFVVNTLLLVLITTLGQSIYIIEVLRNSGVVGKLK